MAKARKDNKGRALRKGESQRSQDNRYVYTYTNLYGKRVYVYALTLAELRQKEKETQRYQLNGGDLYTAEMLDLNTLVDRCLHLKMTLAHSTLSGYSEVYNRYCKNTIGVRKVASIKYSDLLALYQNIMDKGKSYDVIKRLNNVLKQSFEMAVRDHIIVANPCMDTLTPFKNRKAKPQIRHALTIEEQQQLLNYLDKKAKYKDYKCLFVVMLGTGMRIGEISALRWDDIDFENREIDINHAITYGFWELEPPYTYAYHYGLPKSTAGIRKIPMVDQVYEVLKELHEEQTVTGFSDMVIDGVSGFVFSTRSGKPYQSATVNTAIHRIVKAHNKEELEKAKDEKRSPSLLPLFSCHSLRHTFCTRFCENGTNVKVIQSLMGHASIHTTMDIYAEVTENAKKKAMEELAKNSKIF